MALFVLGLMAVTFLVSVAMLVYPKIRARNEIKHEIREAMKNVDEEYEHLCDR